jgi:hypothetical protein
MTVFAVKPPDSDAHGAALSRRWLAAALAGASLAAVLTALGVGLVLSRGHAPLTRDDRVFEAMVAAPIISIEAEAEAAADPAIVVVAPPRLPRARRPRPAAAPAAVVKAAPPVAAPRVVAALPREAMPPPFVVVY